MLEKGVTVKSCRYCSHSCRRHRHKARTQCHCQPHLGPESLQLCRTQWTGPLKLFPSCILELFCIWLWNRMAAIQSEMLSPAWNIRRLSSICLSIRKQKYKPKSRYKGFHEKDSASIKEGCVSEIAEVKEYAFIHSEAVLLLNLIQCGSAPRLKRQVCVPWDHAGLPALGWWVPLSSFGEQTSCVSCTLQCSQLNYPYGLHWAERIFTGFCFKSDISDNVISVKIVSQNTFRYLQAQ